MKFIIILLIAAGIFSIQANAQDYLTRNGNVSFFSHTALEDIKADNNEVVSLLNTATGDIEFKIAIKSFHFRKAAMEQHFNNADYMDSEKYPKAGFKGKITNLSDINFSKDGSYNVTVQGDLTIKDVTKPVTSKGVIVVKNGTVSAQSTFNIMRTDFHVVGEAFVQQRIAQELQVTVDCRYDKR